MWVDDTPITVKAMVQGDGRNLLLYKLGAGNSFKIPFSSLTVTQDRDAKQYMYRIDENSMLKALSAEQNELIVTMIMDTIAQVKVSAITEIALPIVTRFDIEYEKQYTQSGEIVLTPDSVLVKAPLAAFDTLTAIYTEELAFKNLSSSTRGTVALERISNAIYSTNMVRYNINVVGYTEISLTRPIQNPNGTLTLPSEVELLVKIPFSLSSDSFNGTTITLSSNYVDRDSLIKEVVVKNLPEGVIEYTVIPQYVECYNVIDR